LPKIRVILKIEDESADRPSSLGDTCGADTRGEMQRIGRQPIERQQLARESEVADEICQPVGRAGALKELSGTLESLHSSSVAEPAISAYIV
jgi:hypothetical protein